LFIAYLFCYCIPSNLIFVNVFPFSVSVGIFEALLIIRCFKIPIDIYMITQFVIHLNKFIARKMMTVTRGSEKGIRGSQVP
jgi:hypothetical protein